MEVQFNEQFEHFCCVKIGYLSGATVVQEVEKSVSNQKVASSIPTVEASLSKTLNPLIAPDVQCAISVDVKCIYKTCKSLWIKASTK